MTSGERTTVSSFRRHVRTGILAELRDAGPATRAELMAALGLSRTALTRVLDGLFAERLIDEEPTTDGVRGAGRPARRIRARRPPRRTLALQVESTRVSVAVVDESGDILAVRRHAVLLADGLAATIDAVRASLDGLSISDAPAPTRLVAAVPTMVAADGMSVHPDGARALMPSWLHPAATERLARAAGLPAFVQNDGRLAALAEARMGAARGLRNVLYIAPGANGIAGGLVLGGRLHVGAGSAGEISHVVARIGGHECPCGQRGCLAAEVREMARRFRIASGLSIVDQDELGPLEAVHEHPEVVREIVTMLARVIGGTINIVHPDAVVIADRLIKDPAQKFVARIASAIPHYAHPALAATVSIRASELGEAAVLAGAGWVDDPGASTGR